SLLALAIAWSGSNSETLFRSASLCPVHGIKVAKLCRARLFALASNGRPFEPSPGNSINPASDARVDRIEREGEPVGRRSPRGTSARGDVAPSDGEAEGR